MIIHEQHITILNIYVAPCGTLNNIVVVHVKELQNIPLNGEVVIVRYFNVDMIEKKKAEALNNYMSNYNLHFLVNKKIQTPTSPIDHLWSNIISVYKVSRLDAYWTDHDMTCLTLNYLNANNS